MIRRLPRWLAYVIAKLGGYFWIPCPVCGDGFAGFEVGSHTSGVQHRDEGDGTRSYKIVCNKGKCQAEARRQTNVQYLPEPLRSQLLQRDWWGREWKP